MPKFKVFLDEKISVWQRVSVTIEANTESDLKSMLSDNDSFNNALLKAPFLDMQNIDVYLETEDHLEYDLNNVSYEKIGV